MIKIQEINECGQCKSFKSELELDDNGYRIPKLPFGYRTYFVCSKTNRKTTEHNLPEWCPLETKEE